jgi:hypothetical protein
MTCICIDDLQPASFRGAPFYVKTDESEFGRRIVTHQYPMRDTPYNEDLGKTAAKYKLSAYVFGDDWIALKDAVVAACNARGPAFLSLPADGPVMVVCDKCDVSRNKDECGYFEIKLTFTEAGVSFFDLGIAQFEGLIGSVIASAIPPITAFVDLAYTVAGVLPFVRTLQTDRVAQFAGDVIAAVEASPSTDLAAAGDTIQSAIGLYQNAAAYAAPDAGATVALCSQPIPAQTIGSVATASGVSVVGAGSLSVTSGAAAIVPVIASIFEGIGASMRPDDVYATVLPFATWSRNETRLDSISGATAGSAVTRASKPVSPSDRADAINGTLLCGVVRSFALMKLAQAISVRSFQTRAEAIQARATVVELFDAQIEQVDDSAVAILLLKARDYAVTSVTRAMATLVPVVTINAPRSMPSLYWANRLYDDADRAQELSERNSAALPAFMPVVFEALAA